MPEQKDFFTRIMEQMSSSENQIDAALQQKMGIYYHYFEGLENLKENTGIQARIPFDMVIE